MKHITSFLLFAALGSIFVDPAQAPIRPPPPIGFCWRPKTSTIAAAGSSTSSSWTRWARPICWPTAWAIRSATRLPWRSFPRPARIASGSAPAIGSRRGRRRGAGPLPGAYRRQAAGDDVWHRRGRLALAGRRHGRSSGAEPRSRCTTSPASRAAATPCSSARIRITSRRMI